MTPSKNPEAMLCELQLTPDETQMIIDEAERVISETLEINDLFIASDRVLPKSEWKLVKSREKVQVYRQRKEKRKSRSSKVYSTCCEESCSGSTSGDARLRSNTNESSSLSSSLIQVRTSGGSSRSDSSGSSVCSNSNCSSEIHAPKPIRIPLLIATGIVAGSVEDVAFGNLAYTERIARHRDAHIKDEYAGTKILATILKPTIQDPFQSLVIKWSTKSVGALSRMRDCVFIEANGIATTVDGERVAYNLVHSIDSIPRIPSSQHLDIVRVNISTCYIARQYTQSSIEVFSRGFSDPGGNLADTTSSSVYANMLLSIVHVVDCAYMKKLVWLTRVKCGTDLRATCNSGFSKPARHCGNCAASLTTFGIHTGTACQACQQEICGKCSVNKKLAIEVSSSEMTTKTVTFCLHCVIEAKQIPTQQVAVATMQTLIGKLYVR